MSEGASERGAIMTPAESCPSSLPLSAPAAPPVAFAKNYLSARSPFLPPSLPAAARTFKPTLAAYLRGRSGAFRTPRQRSRRRRFLRRPTRVFHTVCLRVTTKNSDLVCFSTHGETTYKDVVCPRWAAANFPQSDVDSFLPSTFHNECETFPNTGWMAERHGDVKCKAWILEMLSNCICHPLFAHRHPLGLIPRDDNLRCF